MWSGALSFSSAAMASSSVRASTHWRCGSGLRPWASVKEMSLRLASAVDRNGSASWPVRVALLSAGSSPASVRACAACSRRRCSASWRRWVARAVGVRALSGRKASAASAVWPDGAAAACAVPEAVLLAGAPSARSAGASSMMMWALVPPTPKALMAARRGVPGVAGHGVASAVTRNGLCSSCRPGLGFLKCRVPGTRLCCRAITVLMVADAPAAMTV